jgi:hypothetical protein
VSARVSSSLRRSGADLQIPFYSYLDAVVHLAYVLLRMLEKYSKSNSYMFVRKRKAKKARRKNRQSTLAVDAT